MYVCTRLALSVAGGGGVAAIVASRDSRAEMVRLSRAAGRVLERKSTIKKVAKNPQSASIAAMVGDDGGGGGGGEQQGGGSGRGGEACGGTTTSCLWWISWIKWRFSDVALVGGGGRMREGGMLLRRWSKKGCCCGGRWKRRRRVRLD